MFARAAIFVCMITLQNQNLSAAINPLGAELKSLKNLQTGFEYIWQANPEFWNRSAPILFPIVGEVKNGVFTVDGSQYPMGRHGFARDSVFTVSHQTETEAVFTLESSAETLKIYPFEFSFSVGFKLEGNKLITTFTVNNTGAKTLNFSVGAHPAFNLPGQKIEDYYIEFEQPETLSRHLLKNNLFSGETELVVSNNRTLALNTALFDKDAIVFKNTASTKMSLKSLKGNYVLTMDFEGFPYFGIWTKPNCHEFLCLEPWCGLADNANFDGDFSEKEGIADLAVGEVFERSFTIEV
jgi:galactose mutarotase-like enzyme